MDPIAKSFNRDYRKDQSNVKIEPCIEVALIEVAGKWAIELNRSNPNLSGADLVTSFRDVYNSLVLAFLTPE